MQTILLSVIAYISTNMDDLFINMFFFAQHRTKTAVQSITAGKYLGIGTLTAISLLGACGIQTLPEQWLSLLGLIPLFLGIKDIISTLRRQAADERIPEASGMLWLNMALVTIANGADNIGVYLPLFAGFHFWQMCAAIIVFALMTGLWCALSKRLTALPLLQELLIRYKAVLVPLVYLLLGLYILFS